MLRCCLAIRDDTRCRNHLQWKRFEGKRLRLCSILMQ